MSESRGVQGDETAHLFLMHFLHCDKATELRGRFFFKEPCKRWGLAVTAFSCSLVFLLFIFLDLR
jgi:hypothetical protein